MGWVRRIACEERVETRHEGVGVRLGKFGSSVSRNGIEHEVAISAKAVT